MKNAVALECAVGNNENTQETATVPPASQAAERLRVQELLRYFQPPHRTVDNGRPRVALDTSLTAYAQLSALKLDCQRSFISLIDHENQYIIAEATRTVSLDSGELHDGEDDAIYLGATTIDISWGVCPNTINVFSSTDGSLDIAAPYVKANRSYYVMNDLSKVPGFESRPYVVGWPHMRYYAEVPIHSPSGLTIGSLCVVDNKPREGLDMVGIEALKEISHAVMDHLELVMSKVQRKRAERMIQGLGLFVDGSDSLRQWWMDSERASRILHPRRRRLTITEQADKEFGPRRNSRGDIPALSPNTSEQKIKAHDSMTSSNPERTVNEPLSRLSIEANGSLEEQTVVTRPAIEPIQDSTASSHLQSAGSITNTTTSGSVGNQSSMAGSLLTTASSTVASGTTQTKSRSDHEGMLSRATNLIREAVGFDGVIFLDPRLGSGRFQTQQDEQTVADYQSSADHMAASSTEHDRGEKELRGGVTATLPILPSTRTDDRMCKVLACSTRIGSELDCPSPFCLALPEAVLHRLIENYPRGCILKYDAEGLVSRSELELAWYSHIPRSQERPNSVDEEKDPLSESTLRDCVEARELWNILPGVRSIILFPLWHSSRGKLFAYNLAWTTDPNRTFEREDFAYLASFGNSIMAELSRLDTVAADRAKADFISSISHELRSPLHGVLASAELLKALTTDSTSIDIINTIEACGSTLLDTMENLLTFAKINNFIVTQAQRKSTLKTETPASGLPPPLKSLTSEIDLSYLVEEVMNANISGHQFRNAMELHSFHSVRGTTNPAASKQPEDAVTVICDIDSQPNWTFHTQAGAWKRIVMNLLGNSLKYTETGFIHVRLSQGEIVISSQGTPMTRICLVVEDSGKGISEDYLKHHLFTPFQQEDPLCPGTGLGLSIVNQLVTSIDGTIDIASEIGSGTKVTISALLEPVIESVETSEAPTTSIKPLPQLSGRKVGLVALDVYPDIQETPTGILDRQVKRGLVIKSSLTRTLKDAFGLDTVTIPSLNSDFTGADILITSEGTFRAVDLLRSHPREIPLIVLSANLTLDYRPVSHLNGPVIYLSQPFGPQLLARALESCIPFCIDNANRLPGSDVASSGPYKLHLALGTGPKQFAQDLTKSPLSPGPVLENYFEQAKQGYRPRALLVEDNPINLKLLVTFVEKLGYPYVTATDGLEAVEAYRSSNGRFDIIFIDIQMPIMDGMAASCEIRKFEQQNGLERTPIIALTGLASADAQEQAVLSGIDLFLTKPVPLRRLRAVVEEHCPAPRGEG